jgi:hypothetical protein
MPSPLPLIQVLPAVRELRVSCHTVNVVKSKVEGVADQLNEFFHLAWLRSKIRTLLVIIQREGLLISTNISKGSAKQLIEAITTAFNTTMDVFLPSDARVVVMMI